MAFRNGILRAVTSGLLLVLVVFAFASQSTAQTTPIVIGRSIVSLNGPWKFRTGDDARWASPDFDDRAWTAMDLTAAPGAHDADVGLTGYVPGWTAKGFPHYAGYAWYRLRVVVDAPSGIDLALAAPTNVDSVYQLYINGHLLGGVGDFSNPKPGVHSVQPRLFALPLSLWRAAPDGKRVAVIAFRVWMGKGAISFNTERGGLHNAPQFGSANEVSARYQLQWLETFKGYVVDAVEPLIFLLLALMAAGVRAFDRADRSYVWLIAALVSTALLRANQPLYFWAQFETPLQYAIARAVLLNPLTLGIWLMVWWAWFRFSKPGWMPSVVAALTLVYAVSQLAAYSFFVTTFSPFFTAAFQNIANIVRVIFAALFVWVAVRGIIERGREGWIALPAIALVAMGLFAQELSELNVPGIWFPFGTGVSRTEYAYAALDIALFVLLQRRLLQFAARRA